MCTERGRSTSRCLHLCRLLEIRNKWQVGFRLTLVIENLLCARGVKGFTGLSDYVQSRNRIHTEERHKMPYAVLSGDETCRVCCALNK